MRASVTDDSVAIARGVDLGLKLEDILLPPEISH